MDHETVQLVSVSTTKPERRALDPQTPTPESSPLTATCALGYTHISLPRQ